MRTVGRLSRLGRALAAALALAVIVVGVPVALVKLAGWPLPHAVPNWHLAYRSIQQQDIPGATIVKAVAVIVWIAWIQMAWAVLWEIAVNLPRYSRSERPRQAPAVPGSISHLAARLVAAALVAGVLANSQGALARPGASTAPLRPLTSATAVVVDSAVHASPMTSISTAATRADGSVGGASRRVTTATESARPIWKVAKGDSLWSVAERSLGDGARYPEIMTRNPYLRTARDVRPGHLLELPPGADVPVDRAPDGASDEVAADAAPNGGDHVVAVSLPSATHVVVRGESIWRIGEERVREAHGDGSRRTVAKYVEAMIDANADQLVRPGDPSLILPGQALDLPAVTDAAVGDVAVSDVAVGDVAVADAAVADDAPLAVPGVVDDTATAPIDGVAPPVEAHPPIEVGAPIHGTFSPPLAPPAAVGNRPATSPVDVFAWLAEQAPRLTHDLHNDQRDRDDGVLPIDLLAGVGAAGVLGGALTWVVRRRRSLRLLQREPGERLASGDDTIEAAERTLHAIGREEVVSWVWAAQRALRPLVAGLANDPMVNAIRVGSDGLEVLFDRPVVSPPDGPFERIRHRSWHLRAGVELDELERVAGNVGPLCPFLVPFGDVDDGALLVNLEAIGALRVEGSDEQTASFLNAAVSFLGSVPWGRDVDVRRLGGPSQLDAFDNVAAVDVAALAGLVDQINALRSTAEGDDANAYTRRLTGDADDWVGTIVVAFDDAPLDVVVAHAEPGGALVVLGGGSTARNPAASTLVVAADGSGHLDPYGLDLAAIAGLPTERAAELIGLFDVITVAPSDAEHTAAAHTAAEHSTAEHTAAEHTTAARLDAAAARTAIGVVDAPADVDVRVLDGLPVVHVGDASPLSPAANAVVAYVALNGASSYEQVRSAVYGRHGITDDAFRSVVGRVRHSLGLDATGAPQLRVTTDGEISLGPDVGCDATRFEALIALARRVDDTGGEREVLTVALTMIGERPFDNSGRYYRWASEPPARFAERLGIAIADAAHRAASLALDADAPGEAERLAAIGLRYGAGNEALARVLARARIASGDSIGALAALDAVGAALRQRDPFAEPTGPTQALCDELSLSHQPA